MKTLSIYLVLAICGGLLQAQEITELKEAKVGFSPLSSEVVRNGDHFTFKVNENYAEEFEADPIAFLNKYFNIANFISSVEEENYDSYYVAIKSSNGRLKADYDKDGNLRKTSERFENIVLPNALRHQLYRDHKGWAMVKNIHVTKAKDGIVKRDFYRVKMQLGDRSKSFKIDASEVEEGRMAGN